LRDSRSRTLPLLSAALATFIFTTPLVAHAESSVAVGGTTLVNKGRVAVGRIPANQRDKFGETFGSGSGMSIDAKSWTRNADGTYKGSLWLLPDRGYNVAGTTDYRARLNTIDIQLTPVAPGATPPAGKEQLGVEAKLADTLLLKDNKGNETTGLDPANGVRQAEGGMPLLPLAPNGKVSLDNEAIARLPDGSMFISDEYGPYIYRFSADGRMISATAPPAAFLPMRHGTVNFSSNNPGPGESAPIRRIRQVGARTTRASRACP